jgi:hypothetical protein
MASILAILAAVGCTYLCHKSGWFWNKRYDQTVVGSVLSLLAGLFAFATVIIYAGAGFIKETAVQMIDDWSKTVAKDKDWRNHVFQTAKENVKELRDRLGRPLENFDEKGADGLAFNSPKSTGIPLNSKEARETCVSTYVNETITSFKARHPILGKMLFAREENSTDIILNDMQEFFSSSSAKTYILGQGFDLGVKQIKGELESGTDRLIKIARISVILFGLSVEVFCFVSIGVLAWRQLGHNRQIIKA